MSGIGDWLARIFGKAEGLLPVEPLPKEVEGAGAEVGDKLVTAELLLKLDWTRAVLWAEHLGPACRRHEIVTRLRVAAFLANVGHETNGGRLLVESLNYDEAGLRRTFSESRANAGAPFARRPGEPADQRGLANAIYGGEWGRKNLGNTMLGDGWKFRGRGLMQLTGRGNYTRFAKTVDKPLNDAFLSKLETENGAANSAAYFWEVSGCNQLADDEDVYGIRRKINGGVNGLLAVELRYAKALAALLK